LLQILLAPKPPILGALKPFLAWLPHYWGLGGGSARSVALISGFGISSDAVIEPDRHKLWWLMTIGFYDAEIKSGNRFAIG
jgi:hypothetical protein